MGTHDSGTPLGCGDEDEVEAHKIGAAKALAAMAIRVTTT